MGRAVSVLCENGRWRLDGGSDGDDLGLHHAQMRRVFQRLLHQPMVFLPIRLHALGSNRRALAEVQRSRLQRDLIGRVPHLAAERVNLVNQMPLRRPADRGVAGHVGNAVERQREQHGVNAHPRACERGFNAGMSRPDHGDGSFQFRIVFHGSFLSKTGVFANMYQKKKVFTPKQAQMPQNVRLGPPRPRFCVPCGRKRLFYGNLRTVRLKIGVF